MPDLTHHNVKVIAETLEQNEQAEATAQRWKLELTDALSEQLILRQTIERLELVQPMEPKTGAVYVDFASDALIYRSKQGGGKKNEAIAKAVGLKGKSSLHVIDATAGLGRDAFVLASLGCKVDMIERSPVVAALLEDGLKRASQHPELASWLPQQLSLSHGPGWQVLEQWLLPSERPAPDVIYLDPMYPHKKKSALVKKEMRLFQQLLGPDEDADKLLEPALALAKQRVVVKRPDTAPFLNQHKPTMSIKSKKHRFDVYLTNL